MEITIESKAISKLILQRAVFLAWAGRFFVLAFSLIQQVNAMRLFGELLRSRRGSPLSLV